MPIPTPIPEPCDDLLETYFFRPIDEGSPAEDTPLMRAYREEIDLIEDYQLTEHYGRSRSDLLWLLVCAFAEVVV